MTRFSLSSAIRAIARPALGGSIAAALLTVPLAGTALASPTANTGRYCVEVYGAPPSPGGISPMQYRNCSTTSMSTAQAGLSSATARAATGGVTAMSSDLLMTWFSDSDYNGSYTNIYGSAGPCDSAGYKITPSSWWQNNMSSVGGTTQCNIARFYTRSKTYAESQLLPTHYLGSTLNDNVGMVQVYRRN